MKSLVRWSTTVALVGSTVVGTLVAGGLRALALTQEQIVQKLQAVPVFTIANSQGVPLTLSSRQNNGQQASLIAGAFISQRDAQAFFDSLKKNDPTISKDPNLVKDFKVIPVPLGEVYRLSQQTPQNQQQKLNIEYVPSKSQVDSALALLKQSGQNVNNFNGTPLFTLGEKKGNEVGYVVVQRDNRKQTPMFFDRELAQAFLDRLKKQPGGVGGNVSIQVLSLEGVLQEMKSPSSKDAKRDEFLSQIELVPPLETLQLIQQNRPAQNQQPNQQRQPAQNQPKR